MKCFAFQFSLSSTFLNQSISLCGEMGYLVIMLLQSHCSVTGNIKYSRRTEVVTALTTNNAPLFSSNALAGYFLLPMNEPLCFGSVFLSKLDYSVTFSFSLCNFFP